ncbi:hypothetical protein QTP88_007080 [Uroleucon formosanum]
MEQFYAELNVLKANIGKNNTLLSDKRYDELVKEVSMLRCLKTKKNPRDFWLQKRNYIQQRLFITPGTHPSQDTNDEKNIMSYKPPFTAVACTAYDLTVL